MNAERQGGAARPKYAVGVDAHSKKLAISIWEGSDPWNPTLYREIKSCEIDAMEKTFERHVPLERLLHRVDLARLDLPVQRRIPRIRSLPDGDCEFLRVGVHAHRVFRAGCAALPFCVHFVILYVAGTYWSRRMLQGCTQIFGVLRPKQVVSAGVQTRKRVWASRLDSCNFSNVSHAHSKWLPVTCCSVSYSSTCQTSTPNLDPVFRNTQYITNTNVDYQLTFIRRHARGSVAPRRTFTSL